MRSDCDLEPCFSRSLRAHHANLGAMPSLPDARMENPFRPPVSERQPPMGRSGGERASHSPSLRSADQRDRMTTYETCNYCKQYVLDPCFDFSEAVRCGRF